MTLRDSSLTVGRFDEQGSNMILVRHFSGQLLLSEEETNQLRTLINEELAHLEPVIEAIGLMDAHEALVAEYTRLEAS